MSYYSGDRFSRKGQGKSEQDKVGRTIHDRVEKLLENRWKYLNPFDMFRDIKTELYRYAVSETEWEAFATLESNGYFKRAVRYHNTFTIENPNAGFTIKLHSKTESFVPIPIAWGNLPNEVAEVVHNWLIRSETYRWEYNIIRDRVASLVRLCSSPGQIERTWPELLGFMPGHVIDKRYEKRARSPYPDGVWEKGWESVHPSERKLKENYRPEVLAGFNDALTEALILPVQDWSEQAPYPEVTLTT